MQIPSGERNKKVEGVNKRDISRLDRCMENTDKTGTLQTKVRVWQNTIFPSKRYYKKKSATFFEHWILKYHIHYYPSVEVWVIAVWCLGRWLFFNSQENKPPFHFSKFFSSACLAVVVKTEEQDTGGELPRIVLALACIFLALAPHYRLGTIQIKMLGDSYMVLEDDQSLRTWCKMKF